MIVFVGLNDAWKCVTVELVNGCTPRIGGVNIVDCPVEPSQWSKVLVLESLCVDCSQRVISWAVRRSVNNEESITAPRNVAFDSASPSSLQLPFTSSVSSGHYSLMAPHQIDASLYSDDLDHLFELATKLFYVPPGHKNGDVTWLRLIHCYLLPLVTFHHDDLASIKAALGDQYRCIKALDTTLLEVSEQIVKLKVEQNALQLELVSCVERLVSEGCCTVGFLKLFIEDLKRREEDTRTKVQITMSQRALSVSASLSEMCKHLDEEMEQQTTQLMKALELRDTLVRALCTLDSSDDQVVPSNHHGDMQAPPIESPPTSPDCGTQATPKVDPRVHQYVAIHNSIHEQKALTSKVVKDKVLALNLREALQVTVNCVLKTNSTAGMDTAIVESIDGEGRGPYLTSEATSMRDQLREIIQSQSSEAGHLHREFIEYLHREWFHTEGHTSLSHMTSTKKELSGLFRSLSISIKGGTGSKRTTPTLHDLPQLVKQHFQKIVDIVSQHIDGCDTNLKHKLWLCYERVFFETCGEHFLTLYQKEHSEVCLRLKHTSLNVSLLNPIELGLCSRPEPWINLFQCRDFSVAMGIHSGIDRQQCVWFKDTLAPPPESEFMKTFGSVVFDISCLQECVSPLDKLQLLVSALRKASSVLADLRIKQMLNNNTYNLSSAAVSGDDLLPLLVLVLLQLHPSFLAHLHLQCCLLEDYMAPFLSLGWHGYSLVTFLSAIKAIAEMHT